MSELEPNNPFDSSGAQAPPSDSGALPPYQPPGVAFTQPVDFVAGVCNKGIGDCDNNPPVSS